jgi:hypothetical protein
LSQQHNGKRSYNPSYDHFVLTLQNFIYKHTTNPKNVGGKKKYKKGLIYKMWSQHKLDVKKNSFQQATTCKRLAMVMGVCFERVKIGK